MSPSTRKEQIEQMLQAEPNDSFLRYALAMEHLSSGDQDAALGELQELICRDSQYVPAYLQAGQILAQLGEELQAAQMLRAGITVAEQAGDQHAASEMRGLLSTLGG